MSAATQPQQLSILRAGAERAEELARLHAELFDASWDAASFGQLLAHPGSVALIAQVSGPPQVAGFVVGQVAADEAEILTLGVAKAWQRQGIGRQLVEAMARTMRRAGARSLYLEVAESNASARALYGQLGFGEAGRRRGYYVRTGAVAEDAISLSLAL